MTSQAQSKATRVLFYSHGNNNIFFFGFPSVNEVLKTRQSINQSLEGALFSPPRQQGGIKRRETRKIKAQLSAGVVGTQHGLFKP